MNESDLQLVRASLRGDSQAFGELVMRLRAPLCGYLGGLMRHHGEDVEEVAQEAFLIAWQKLPTLRDPARFSAWLFRIARNLAHRQVATLQPVALSQEPPAAEERDGESERIVVLMAAVAGLSPGQREVVLRKHFQGATGEQIAEQLGVPTGTVWSRLSRAYAELREQLAAVET